MSGSERKEGVPFNKHIYIKRGKTVLNKKNMYSTAHPSNTAWVGPSIMLMLCVMNSSPASASIIETLILPDEPAMTSETLITSMYGIHYKYILYTKRFYPEHTRV